MKDITVKDLLDGKLNKQLDDKLFWYANDVEIFDNYIKICIKNNSLVTFDDINIEGVTQKVSKLSKIKQDDKKNLKDVLVSSGSFLFINDKLAVTQREDTTKYDPSLWTTPAGRCDRTIIKTGIKETIEEIEIKKNGKTLYPDISKNFIANIQNIEFYNTSFENSINLLKIHNIKLYLENILIEECKAWFYFSKKVNTIEFRIPIFATLIDEKNLTITNPEFGTTTGLRSIDKLKEMEVVPALKQLLKEI